MKMSGFGCFLPVYFQKYSQLLEEKEAAKNIMYKELNCIKNGSLMEGKNKCT
jgi:C-type lectin domain family 4 protein A